MAGLAARCVDAGSGSIVGPVSKRGLRDHSAIQRESCPVINVSMIYVSGERGWVEDASRSTWERPPPVRFLDSCDNPIDRPKRDR